MATEKTSEGIRLFNADAQKLAQFVSAKLKHIRRSLEWGRLLNQRRRPSFDPREPCRRICEMPSFAALAMRGYCLLPTNRRRGGQLLARLPFGAFPRSVGVHLWQRPDRRCVSTFLISGVIGVGLGDTGFYEALPRLGSRRSVLLVQCFTAPIAALIEWLWLGTTLNSAEIACIAVILIGVAIAPARAGRPSAHHAARMAHRHRVQRPRRVLRRARHRREPQGLRGRARGGAVSRTPARRAISECWAACYFRPSVCCWR